MTYSCSNATCESGKPACRNIEGQVYCINCYGFHYRNGIIPAFKKCFDCGKNLLYPNSQSESHVKCSMNKKCELDFNGTVCYGARARGRILCQQHLRQMKSGEETKELQVRIRRSDEEFCPRHPDTPHLLTDSGTKYCRECYKDSNRERLYGLTPDIFQQLIGSQGGTCAFETCSSEYDKARKRSLVVDHDHSDGRVRGLLCDSHNKLLGFARDDINILQDAIKYLLKEN